MAKAMLIADDLLNATSFSQERSHLIHSYSAELAQKLTSSAKLLYVKDPSAKGHLLDEDQLCAETAEFFKNKNLRIQFLAKVGAPVEEILKALDQSPKPGLLVMGTHGKTGLDRLFLGSVAEEVIRNASIPVLILGPQVRSPKVKTGGKILVPTDLTKNSRRAEAYALKLAASLKSEVVLFHSTYETLRVASQFTAIAGTAYIDDTFIKTIQQQAEKSLQQKVRLFKSKGVRASFILDSTEPVAAESLTEEAQKGYQFIIMGTHGRSSLVSAFLGSTARQVLLTTTVPTIIVRSHLK